MSKSIYDEALEELRCATIDLKDLEIIHNYDVSKIEQALKQAQKQDKIIEIQNNIIKQYQILGRTCEYDPSDEIIRDECYKGLNHWKKELKDLEK